MVLDIGEARRAQTIRQRRGRHRVVGVADVQQPEERGMHAVTPREDSAGRQHSVCLRKQLIL
ncbi:Uncharacterised protein [Mycobacteroides abscessus subsp. abscessus]|nr:Uncharacterised protein [Mycobacteroides abscessus subsp. abscessus]SLE74665.1 Uncharacterised protein [Mycobacteroides abscessus subsp. massiliense]